MSTKNVQAFLASVAFVASTLAAALVSLNPWPDVVFASDFFSFWSAASMIAGGQGASLFDLDAQHAFQYNLRQALAVSPVALAATGYNPYPNLPALAMPYLPLSSLPPSTAYLLWWPVSLLSFVAAMAVLLRDLPWRVPLAAAMLMFGGVASTLVEGQPYGFLLLSLSLGLSALGSGRTFRGGVFLGLLWVKPQYAILFPLVFAAKGRWRELSGVAVGGLAVVALSLWMVGPSAMLDYLGVLRGIGSYSQPDVSPQAMVNWRGLLISLVPGVPESIGSPLVLAFGMVTVAAGAWAWRGKWDATSPLFPRQMLVLVLASIIASPHSHIHGAVLLLAPVAMTFYRPFGSDRLEGAWRGLLIFGWLLSMVVWPIGNLGVIRWVLVPYFLVLMGFLICQIDVETRHLSIPGRSRSTVAEG